MNPRHSIRLTALTCVLPILLAGLAACEDDKTSGSVQVDENNDQNNNENNTSNNGASNNASNNNAPNNNASNNAPNNNTPQPIEHVDVIQVDQFTAAVSDGTSGRLRFTVPEGAISVTISLVGEDRTSWTLGSWVDAEGTELVYDGWVTADPGQGQLCVNCANRISVASGASAVIAPNNQGAVLTPGQHTITLYAFTGGGFSPTAPASGDVEVTIFAKVRPELPTEGILDLNLHFTGAGGWDADKARNDPEFLAILDEVRALYGQIGLQLGQIAWVDIDPAYRVIENIIQGDSDLQELFTQSEGNDANALNLFFVEELAAGQAGQQGFGIILGISGGIPGPPLLQGSTRSGVAIAVESHRLIPGGGMETTIAHEVGHFLGLFHTSEQDFGFGPQLHDPIDDTPENDDAYLMFNTGSGSMISPWQGRVMLSNPWVRHNEEP